MRESHSPNERSLNLPSPDLYKPAYKAHETMSSQPQDPLTTTHDGHRASQEVTRRDHTIDYRLGFFGHDVIARNPVSESQTTRSPTSTMATNVEYSRSICSLPAAHKHDTTPPSRRNGSNWDTPTNYTSFRHTNRRNSSSPDQNQDSIDDQIETDFVPRPQLQERFGHRETDLQTVDGNIIQMLNKMDLQKDIAKNTPKSKNDSTEQRKATAEVTEAEDAQQEVPSRTSKRKTRSKKQRRRKDCLTSETNWSEDVENYVGHKPIDELVKYITG